MECVGNTQCKQYTTPPTSFSCVCYKCRITQLYRLNSPPIAFFRSQNWFKIALVGLGIHSQNGQRNNFTHQQPCFYANSFGVLITVKSSLTSSFFEKYASTHHSSFMMPAWGASAVENDSKNTYITYQIWARLLVYRVSNGQILTLQWEFEPSVLSKSKCFQLNCLYAVTKFEEISYA